MNVKFSCPVCGQELELQGKTYRCINNHCFDKAKQGYVNLLQSQKSSKKRHGDDSLMVKARQDFLEKGYYNNLCAELVKAVSRNAVKDTVLIDLGCGECWYTAQIYKKLVQDGKNPAVFGIDISKQAIIYGAKRCRELNLAVASTADIPMADESCDIVVCVFAPYAESEVLRVLKRGGCFIKVFPLENHLMGLKKAIYDRPYKNEVNEETPEYFEKKDFVRISNVIHLENNEDIINLFKMTPYYYKTGRDDQMKSQILQSLETETEFGIVTYKKL
ncbi:MAG: methyltransferase domain-containing protein [Clostridia bacterium]|nr:methyltransferase domain-containing protein [Clostridia bacterium]